MSESVLVPAKFEFEARINLRDSVECHVMISDTALDADETVPWSIMIVNWGNAPRQSHQPLVGGPADERGAKEVQMAITGQLCLSVLSAIPISLPGSAWARNTLVAFQCRDLSLITRMASNRAVAVCVTPLIER
jgi:hypothetical protein